HSKHRLLPPYGCPVDETPCARSGSLSLWPCTIIRRTFHPAVAMNSPDSIDYQRISQAIGFLVAHMADQPSLEEVAAHVGLSPFHFQRLFSRWAGVTPKRFLQVLTVERAKTLLRESASLLDVSETLGLSSGSRLY